ncbi:MAG: hypothetical protein AB7K08_05345 [Microbacteriaceae bacterium]
MTDHNRELLAHFMAAHEPLPPRRPRTNNLTTVQRPEEDEYHEGQF